MTSHEQQSGWFLEYDGKVADFMSSKVWYDFSRGEWVLSIKDLMYLGPMSGCQYTAVLSSRGSNVVSRDCEGNPVYDAFHKSRESVAKEVERHTHYAKHSFDERRRRDLDELLSKGGQP